MPVGLAFGLEVPMKRVRVIGPGLMAALGKRSILVKMNQMAKAVKIVWPHMEDLGRIMVAGTPCQDLFVKECQQQ